MKLLIALLFSFITVIAFGQTGLEQWKEHSRAVTIKRDNFGIPHIHGKTDADAVFALMYAQCEDDLARIEENYLEKLGRMSELKGPSHLFSDLQNRLMYDSADAVRDYKKAVPWLRSLLNAFADGMNYYLYKNPGKARILHRYEPWYPLLWTDGSIGASSTGGISGAEFAKFYNAAEPALPPSKTNESNGFAFAPSITKNGKAILYINPHVTFYFRPEVHVKSDEGLNSYGAVTWGQFFVYQGFNEFCGWMHTSSDVDVADVYALHVRKSGKGYQYLYDNKWKPLGKKEFVINYREGTKMRARKFITWWSHHGPVMAERNGKWLALKANNRMMEGLIQSFLRTKARSLKDFTAAMNLRGNPSNNTVYADKDGNIAYWHGNFIPERDDKTDWSRPVDGSTSSTMWKGIHELEEIISVKNPANGWLQNCNSTPFTAAAELSPDSNAFPYYMSPEGDNFRGAHAVALMKGINEVTLESAWQLGYDRRIPIMQVLLPRLINTLKKENDPARSEMISMLEQWDMNADTNSTAQSLAIEWLDRLGSRINSLPKINRRDGYYEKSFRFAQTAEDKDILEPFNRTIEFLQKTYGTWKVSWGAINRIQRQPQGFNDTLPSYAVPFVTSVYGMLPSFSSLRVNTARRYGYHGNSFVCAVEFGSRVNAIALLAGGQSGDPDSPHYFDQGKMYASGKYRKVLFYKDEIDANTNRTYQP